MASLLAKDGDEAIIHRSLAVHRTNSVQEIKAIWSEKPKRRPSFPKAAAHCQDIVSVR
jgi:hypothetical protein